MKRLFCQAWLAMSVLLVSCVAGCASLPEVDQAALNAKATPTVAGAQGKMAPAQAKELLARRWMRATRDLKASAAQEEAATGVPLIAGNKITLLYDGPQTMKAMMEAAAAAKDSINLETYIFDQDEVGLKFADLLIEKQRGGVTVNVMYDSVGTLGVPAEFFERMRAAGITLLAFNPVNPLKARGKWRINNRDHRKIMVVDGKVAFTGGINISSDYANSSLFGSRSKPSAARENSVGWRDTHIRIEGPAVAALQWAFVDNWLRQEAGELPEKDYFPKLAPAGDKIVRILATRPERGFEFYKAFLLAIQEAKSTIHITAAYFVPDRQFVEELGKAARRGVEVKLVLPGVSDHGLVFHAGRAFYQDLLDAGVKIYNLQVAVLHAKTAVIDGQWSTVGSANIDRRSFLHNYELNVIVLDKNFGTEMESAFQEDLRDSREVTREAWARRPYADRLKEWSARLFEYWL